MRVSFHPEAEAEFSDAVDYYGERQAGLGLDFARELSIAVHNAAEHPHLWREIGPKVRRCLVHRFPYGVLYTVGSEEVFILAVMHLHRDPDYWKHRL